MTTGVDFKPKIVLLFSGKRKSGKDFLADSLLSKLGSERAQIIHISEPIKKHWSESMGLDLPELLSDSAYKEHYRKQMIEWSDARRSEDYGVFCREACLGIEREICIVSDVRRKTDMRFFLETFGADRVRTVRIDATKATRAARGWQFKPGVDDVQSECDLDDFWDWDLLLLNDGVEDTANLLNCLEMLVDQLDRKPSDSYT